MKKYTVYERKEIYSDIITNIIPTLQDIVEIDKNALLYSDDYYIVIEYTRPMTEDEVIKEKKKEKKIRENKKKLKEANEQADKEKLFQLADKFGYKIEEVR